MAVENFRLDESYLIAICVEAIFYGLYLPLFFACVVILLRKNRESRVSMDPLLWAVVLMFILATTHIAFALNHARTAFIMFGGVPNGASLYIANPSTTANIAMNAIFAIVTLIADTVIVYRCYMVWGKNVYVVIVPFITELIIIGTGLYGTFELGRLNSHDTVFAQRIQQIVTVVFSSTLGWQVVVSSLIAGRLIWIRRRSESLWGSSYSKIYNRIVFLIVESALIYCLSLVVFLTLYLLHHNAEKIAYQSLVQITVICPTLMIVRVGLNLWEKSSAASHKSAARSLPASVAIVVSREVETHNPHDYPLKRLDSPTETISSAHHSDGKPRDSRTPLSRV